MITSVGLRIPIDAETELTLLDLAHASEFFDLIERNRPYLREWLAWLDRTKSVADSEQFIDFTRREFAENKAIALWIWQSGRIVGILHLTEWSAVNRKAAIGYWVGQEWRGQGIAKKVVRGLCEYAFQVLNLNRLEIRCAAENTASQAVPIALKFKREGILRDNEWLYDHFVDHVVFSLLKTDWENGAR